MPSIPKRCWFYGCMHGAKNWRKPAGDAKSGGAWACLVIGIVDGVGGVVDARRDLGTRPLHRV